MHIAAGAFFGGVIGGGIEAVRQYRAEGKISDWGKVGGAAAGGAVSGALTAAVPGSGVLGVAATNGMGSAAGGVVDRAVASGGKDLGTLADVKRDAVMGAVTGVGGKYAGQAVSKVKPKLSVPAAPKPTAGAPGGSPKISAKDLTGKSQDELRDFAKNSGLKPHPNKPDKFMDPVTGKERLRLDPGHKDKVTGMPYNDPKAAVPHAHGYGPDGKTKIVDPSDGNPHFPTK